MSKEITRRKWSVNEIAFIEFARFKGLKYPQIASILDERTAGAANAMGWKIELYKAGKHDPTERIIKTIQDGLVFEAQVRGGQYPEVKEAWLNRISRVTGITYKQKPVEEPQEEEELTDDVGSCDTCSSDEVHGAVPAEEGTTDLLTIRINVEAVSKLLSIIFGK